MPRPRRTNPADSLSVVAPLAARWIERLLASHEPTLTTAQFVALRAIAREPLSNAELARRAAVSGAAVSQLVAELHRAGLVDSAPEPDDRRFRLLRLTEEGTRALASTTALLRRGLSPLLGALTRPEADALARGLEALEALLTGTPPPRRPPPPRPRRRPR